MTCTFHEYMYKMKYIYAGMNVDGLEMHDKVSSSQDDVVFPARFAVEERDTGS